MTDFTSTSPSMASGDEWYVIVDDQSPEIQYQGKWANEVVPAAFNSTLSVTTTAGSSAFFKFNGTSAVFWGLGCAL